jgi:hypothetical protein
MLDKLNQLITITPLRLFRRLLFHLILTLAPALSLITTTEASWTRIMSSSPLPKQKNYFVATYLYKGTIDYGIPVDNLFFYVTLVYDVNVTKNPIIYAQANTKFMQINDSRSHHDAEEWLINTQWKRDQQMQDHELKRSCEQEDLHMFIQTPIEEEGFKVHSAEDYTIPEDALK